MFGDSWYTVFSAVLFRPFVGVRNSCRELGRLVVVRGGVVFFWGDWVDESAYSGLENVYSLSKFKETFALT